MNKISEVVNTKKIRGSATTRTLRKKKDITKIFTKHKDRTNATNGETHREDIFLAREGKGAGDIPKTDIPITREEIEATQDNYFTIKWSMQ
jgi:hypothetical protein